MTRQAKFLARQRAARRAAGRCIDCDRPSVTLRCGVCRPRKTAAQKLPANKISALRRAAARARWRGGR